MSDLDSDLNACMFRDECRAMKAELDMRWRTKEIEGERCD